MKSIKTPKTNGDCSFCPLGLQIYSELAVFGSVGARPTKLLSNLLLAARLTSL